MALSSLRSKWALILVPILILIALPFDELLILAIIGAGIWGLIAAIVVLIALYIYFTRTKSGRERWGRLKGRVG